jgi:GH15 family glucan-1,4-alpha-glucosidase
VIAALVTTTLLASPPHPGPSPFTSAGLIGSATLPGAHAPIDRDLAAHSSYLTGTSVLALPGDRARLIPPGGTEPVTLPMNDPRVTAAVSADRAWLASGRVPGGTPYERSAATRALLDLRLLTSPNGACVASWAPNWNYVWPRDGAFAVAAFSATGHRVEARRILSFLASAQASDGLWAARYQPDGSPVTDGRTLQLDAIGWILWGAWYYTVTDPHRDPATLRGLWPMVARAADRAASLVGPDGLPPASSDYWERAPETEAHPGLPTLGVVAPLRAGLRAAADLAHRTGNAAEAGEWGQAAVRLDHAIETDYAPYGYPRQPAPGSTPDSAVTFLAPPFAPASPRVARAVEATGDRLRMPNGGVLPGANWPGSRAEAWTPETAMFGLAETASGDRSAAAPWMSWLLTHRTAFGSFPERVDDHERPASVAPLGWTSATMLLALTAQRGSLPIPPAPRGGPASTD